MVDARDVLFSKIHAQWLKPKGFRKKCRISKASSKEGLLLSVALESGSTYPMGPRYFDVELRATHPSLPTNRALFNIGLCAWTEGHQCWSYDYDAPTADLFDRICAGFSTAGTQLLDKISILQGLAELFEQVDSVWWYQGHAWCLDRIGKVDEGLSVIQAAIQHAPHDNFREHAERVLQLRLNEC